MRATGGLARGPFANDNWEDAEPEKVFGGALRRFDASGSRNQLSKLADGRFDLSQITPTFGNLMHRKEDRTGSA